MESLQQAENIRIPVRLTPEELKEKELQYMVSKANNDIKADGLENIPDVVVVPVWWYSSQSYFNFISSFSKFRN